MKRSTLVALTGLTGMMVGVCSSGLVEVSAKPVSYKLPNETAAFKPGPNLEIVRTIARRVIRPTMSRSSLGVLNSRKTSGGPR